MSPCYYNFLLPEIKDLFSISITINKSYFIIDILILDSACIRKSFRFSLMLLIALVVFYFEHLGKTKKTSNARTYLRPTV